MSATPPREGKIELVAELGGLLFSDVGRLESLEPDPVFGGRGKVKR